MMKDCRKGKIDRIYTKSVSRFTRNIVNCLEYVRQLKNLGIGVNFEKENIKMNILKNEKYTGAALLQKTYTVDCISHKAVKKNSERVKYLVTDAHKGIIDRDTFNRVQQEIAKRISKRKKFAYIAITSGFVEKD